MLVVPSLSSIKFDLKTCSIDKQTSTQLVFSLYFFLILESIMNIIIYLKKSSTHMWIKPRTSRLKRGESRVESVFCFEECLTHLWIKPRTSRFTGRFLTKWSTCFSVSKSVFRKLGKLEKLLTRHLIFNVKYSNTCIRK